MIVNFGAVEADESTAKAGISRGPAGLARPGRHKWIDTADMGFTLNYYTRFAKGEPAGTLLLFCGFACTTFRECQSLDS